MGARAIDIVSICPLRVASVVWRGTSGGWVQTVVAKATYDLGVGECALADQQDEVLAEDSHFNGDATRSLFAPGDLAPFKVKADVLLVGHAFAPRKEPVRSLVARLAVAEVDKRIEIVGDRVVAPDGQLREGMRFSSMPVRYELAAGGPGTWNPVGVSGRPDGQGLVRLPNLLPPGAAQGDPKQPVAPVGFGPIAPRWPLRARSLERVASSWPDPTWRDWPLPERLDPAYFNVAPPDQQVAGLRADQPILLEHLHRDLPRLSTRLPGLLPVALLEVPGEPSQDVRLACDTLWIDTERSICTVTWRGQISLERKDLRGRVVISIVEPPAYYEAETEQTEQIDSKVRALDASPPWLTPAALGISSPGQAPRAAASVALRPGPPASVAPRPGPGSTAPPPPPPPPRVPAPSSPGGPPPPPRVAPLSSPGGPAPPPRVAPPSSPGASPPPVTAAAAPGVQPPPLLSLAATPGAPPPPLMSLAAAPGAQQPPLMSPGALPSAPPLMSPAAPPSAPPQRARPPLDSSPPQGEQQWAQEPRAGTGTLTVSEAVGARTAGEGAPPIGREAALGGVLGASDAAADPVRPAPEVAAAPAPVSQKTPARGATIEAVELLWFDPAFASKIRRSPDWKPILADLRPAAREEQGDVDSPAEERKARDRRDVAAILGRGAAIDGDALDEAIAGAMEEGTFSPPLVLLAGELELPFDPVEALRATVAAAAPFAPGDKGLKDTLESVSELLKTPGMDRAGSAAEGLTTRVKDAFAQGFRTLPAGSLEAHADRALLEQRHYQRRNVLGQPWLRALLTPAGSPPIPTYLPEALASDLPMFQRFRVRLIAEARPQLDEREAHPSALRAVALGRMVQRAKRA